MGPYWANTSSNTLASVIQKGSGEIKETFETLLRGETIRTKIDEQIIYDQLDYDENAVWSLMLAAGYLKVDHTELLEEHGQWREIFELKITNFEVMVMVRNMVRDWFASAASNYNGFIQSLLKSDIEAMNVYMNRIAIATFSFFGCGSQTTVSAEPERFYHGFVLGLIVDLEDRYTITSNRESGFGRYDIMLEPKSRKDPAILMEFKVQTRKEPSLEETARSALLQIRERKYSVELEKKGFLPDEIHSYGFAFRGKEVLILSEKE